MSWRKRTESPGPHVRLDEMYQLVAADALSIDDLEADGFFSKCLSSIANGSGRKEGQGSLSFLAPPYHLVEGHHSSKGALAFWQM